MFSPVARTGRFDLRPGQILGGKYVVEAYLGGGLEGEVYRVREARRTRATPRPGSTPASWTGCATARS
jgi:hypothetical protein